MGVLRVKACDFSCGVGLCNTIFTGVMRKAIA